MDLVWFIFVFFIICFSLVVFYYFASSLKAKELVRALEAHGAVRKTMPMEHLNELRSKRGFFVLRGKKILFRYFELGDGVYLRRAFMFGHIIPDDCLKTLSVGNNSYEINCGSNKVQMQLL